MRYLTSRITEKHFSAIGQCCDRQNCSQNILFSEHSSLISTAKKSGWAALGSAVFDLSMARDTTWLFVVHLQNIGATCRQRKRHKDKKDTVHFTRPLTFSLTF